MYISLSLFCFCLSLINLFISSYFIAFSVFVRFPDGAAMRAGVQTGDRIIKVLCSSAAVLKQPVSRSAVLSQYRVYRLPPCGHLVFPTPSFPALRLYGTLAMQSLYVNFVAFFYSPNITIAVLQVNGTLVTHSNHIEVVKLIKCKVFCLTSPLRLFINSLTPKNWHHFLPLAGSYVALTVLGRPPGLAQIPLSEAESEMLGVSISSPNSPAAERPYSPQDRFSSTLPSWVWKSCLASVVLCALCFSFVIMLELFTAAVFCLYSCDGLSFHLSFHIRFRFLKSVYVMHL